MVYVPVVQLTVTLVTLPAPTVPVPPETEQVCTGPLGWVSTVTAKAAPLATGVAKVNAPFAETVRLSPPLSCKTTVSADASPMTVPPTVYLLVVQLTATLVTFAPPTVPVPIVTAHVWAGLVGWVSTVTAYGR